MNVQQLRHRPDEPGLPAVRPGLPALWGANHPANAAGVTWQNGVFAAPHGSAGSVGGARAQRVANPGHGQRPASHQADTWPGHLSGVRRPDYFETALSCEEVAHAMKHGLLKAPQ